MIVDSGKYYLYRHIRLDKNVPFYIGIGTKKDSANYKTIYTRMFEKHGRTKYWKNIYKKGYLCEVLLETDDINFLYQKEIEFISLYGRIDLKTGTLVNLNSGGKYYGTITPHNIVEFKKNMRERHIRTGGGPNLGKKGKLCPISKMVYCYHADGKFMGSFYSMSEAADFFKIKKPNVVYAIKKNTIAGDKKFFLSYQGGQIAPFLTRNQMKSISVYELNKKTNEIFKYPTIKMAAEYLGMKESSIHDALRGGVPLKRNGNILFKELKNQPEYLYEYPSNFSYQNQGITITASIYELLKKEAVIQAQFNVSGL